MTTPPVHFNALGAHVKLGKLAPQIDENTPKFAKYATLTLPTPPKSNAWGSKVPSFPMFANDSLGDCTCAAVGHQEQVWTSNQGQIWTPTTTEVTNLYWATGTGDTGRSEQSVLEYWRTQGFGDSKRKIAAYTYVNPLNRTEVKQAHWLFGGLYIGIALPISAQGQSEWSVVSGPNSAPGSWGGHAVNVIAYTRTHVVVVTWGMQLKMTWGFWNKYVDEAWAILSNDWVDGTANLPATNGFNWTQLQADLGQLN